MRNLLFSVSVVALLSACASNKEPPSFAHSAPAPAPVDGYLSTGVTLPLIQDLFLHNAKSKAKASPGVKRPNKSQMSGPTWIPDFDPDSEYVVPVQTTNATGTRMVQQVLVTSDLPAGVGSCATKGVQAAHVGNGFAITLFPGAPVGSEQSCSVQFGGLTAKLIIKAVERRSISELRLIGRKKRGGGEVPQGVCQDANYKVSKIVDGGPLGACTIVTASGAGTKTFVKLPGNTRSVPIVKTDDGGQLRRANTKYTKLPSGEFLLEIQGSVKQAQLIYQTGESVYLTRGK